MNDAELYALIESDPDATAKAAIGDDSGCAARCSEIAPTIRQPVDAGKLMDAMMAAGVWQKLEAAAPPGSTDPPASTARTMMTRLNQSRPVDLDNPAVQSIVNDCITHGLMTQGEAQQLNTLGNAAQIISPAQVSEAMRPHRGGV
jgi:hypothetical protein